MHEPALTTVCRVCGTAFAAPGDGFGDVCLGCLLGAALNGGDASQSTPPVDATPPRPGGLEVHGARFAHYEISTHAGGAFAALGRGAMGLTSRAVDTVLHHEVALKVVAPVVAGNPQARARFLREAQAAASLRHPHIASVFFFGERAADRQLFYAMELIEGETLQARVARAGGLPADTVVEIGVQVAAALAAAEARGLTHRDLKPANVMLGQSEAVNAKLIDFGLARTILGEPDGATRQTAAGEFVGTPAFASPEHFNVWQDTDARSDFYALGATLWYALTGRVPFAGRTPAEVRERQLHAALPLGQLRAARVPRPVVDLLRSLLSADPAGRPQTARALAAALADCRRRIVGARPERRWRAAMLAVAVSGLILAAAAGGLVYQHGRTLPTPAPTQEKSIAVLPFNNLSADKNDAFFTNGVQDEILTDLGRITDLKVIARSSVLGYADPAKRPPDHEIGRALGVAYLLEGSVQRVGDRVHLTARLTDAAHDRQVWSDTFDRNLADVFALQSEVATTIVGKLQARLSGREKAALDEPPTRDLAAYELYLHAKEIGYNFDPNTSTKGEPLVEAVRLLEEATTRDPDFYAAWCMLANDCGSLLFLNIDPRPDERRFQAEKALENVRRLRPDAGETHLTVGVYYYNIHEPERGRPEMALARQTLTNNWKAMFMFSTTSIVDGRYAEALAAMEKARVLNPRNLSTLIQLSVIYGALRRYDDAARVAEDAIAAGIGVDYFTMRHASIVHNQTGDTSEYHAVFRHLAGQGQPSERTLLLRYDIARRDRDFDEAARVLAADPREEFIAGTHYINPRSYLTGLLAYDRGDLAAARQNFEAARPVFEEAIRRRPDDATSWSTLADVDARLGRKEDALNEAQRAATLMPISRDAGEGAKMATGLGWVYYTVGEKERSLTDLESLENVPFALDYGFLNTHPDWSSLRSEPRFQALLQASRKPVDLTKFNPADFPPPTPTPSVASAP